MKTKTLTALLTLSASTLALAADPAPTAMPPPGASVTQPGITAPAGKPPPPLDDIGQERAVQKPKPPAVPDPDVQKITDPDQSFAITRQFQLTQWIRNRQKTLAGTTKDICTTGFGPPSICANYIIDPDVKERNAGQHQVTSAFPMPAPPPPGPGPAVLPTPAAVDAKAEPALKKYSVLTITGPADHREADFVNARGILVTLKIASLVDDMVVTDISGSCVYLGPKATAKGKPAKGTSYCLEHD